MDTTHAENAQFAFVFGETISHTLLAWMKETPPTFSHRCIGFDDSYRNLVDRPLQVVEREVPELSLDRLLSLGFRPLRRHVSFTKLGPISASASFTKSEVRLKVKTESVRLIYGNWSIVQRAGYNV